MTTAVHDKLPFFKNLIPGKIYWIDTDVVTDYSKVSAYIAGKINSKEPDYAVMYDDSNIISLLAEAYSGKFKTLISSIMFEKISLEMKRLYPRYDLKLYKLPRNDRNEKHIVVGKFLPLVIITGNKSRWSNDAIKNNSSVYILTQNEYMNEKNLTFNTVVIDENKNSGYETLIKSKDFNRIIFLFPKSKIGDHNLLRIRKITDNNILSVLHILRLFYTFFQIIAPNYDYYTNNFSLSLN